MSNTRICTRAEVRAKDLRESDVALIGHRWRYIYATSEAAQEALGVDPDHYRERFNLNDRWVVIRHSADEVGGGGEYEDAFVHRWESDLITIQLLPPT